jgi:hypothetical protein
MKRDIQFGEALHQSMKRLAKLAPEMVYLMQASCIDGSMFQSMGSVIFKVCMWWKKLLRRDLKIIG